MAALLLALVILTGLSGCVQVDPGAGSEAVPATASEPAPVSNISSVLTARGWNPDAPPDLSHEPPFPLEEGTIPSRDQALEFKNRFNRFLVEGDEGLDDLRAEGYFTGAGTREDPYVLEKFYVDGDLAIVSTHRALILRDGYVKGQLRLNYVGDELYVHHVYASDLRINENIERSGTNTGGLFHDNQFAFVGQIRHFIGEFRDNEIGPKPEGAIQSFLGDTGPTTLANEVVFNFDGFHGADVHHNRFVGFVDIKLHGHNHGDCFTCPVHDHTDAAEFPDDESDHDTLTHDDVADALGFRSRHSVRYASLLFRDNEIRVEEGLALRYNDRAHAGDDRTANSEPNEHLNDNHVHFQDVTIRGNHLVGGGLAVETFNAEDENHPTQNRGLLRVLENDVVLRYEDDALLGAHHALDAVRLSRADGLELRVRDNHIAFERKGDAPLLGGQGQVPLLTGFRLDGIDASNLTLAGNMVEAGEYGVFAARMTDDVHWWLQSNEFRTTHAWRGQDVGNPPEES